VAKQPMLKFVTVGKEMPEKRDADKRTGDFDEIYGEYARDKAAEQAGVAASAACPIASRIARCTTTSPIG
jgi:glutamate synthase (NADPH/NADH) small chain